MARGGGAPLSRLTVGGVRARVSLPPLAREMQAALLVRERARIRARA